MYNNNEDKDNNSTKRSSKSTKIQILSRSNKNDTDNSHQCDIMSNNMLGEIRLDGHELFTINVDANNPTNFFLANLHILF